MEEQKVWYLCDGNVPECKKTHCYKNTDKEACRHTSDIAHAKNFKKKGNPVAGIFYQEKSLEDEKVGHVDATDYDLNELP